MKNGLNEQFKTTRKDFDELHRKVERQYYHNEQNKLVELETHDPKTFGDYTNGKRNMNNYL